MNSNQNLEILMIELLKEIILDFQTMNIYNVDYSDNPQ